MYEFLNRRSIIFDSCAWWPDGDTSADPEDYQMSVHLFGDISSPSCANFALRKTADDNERDLGKQTADALRTNK